MIPISHAGCDLLRLLHPLCPFENLRIIIPKMPRGRLIRYTKPTSPADSVQGIVIAQHLLLLSRYVTVRIQDGGVEVVEEEQRLEMSLEI
jgi:hypothetical protein